MFVLWVVVVSCVIELGILLVCVLMWVMSWLKFLLDRLVCFIMWLCLCGLVMLVMVLFMWLLKVNRLMWFFRSYCVMLVFVLRL